jgi:hypothetical protein
VGPLKLVRRPVGAGNYVLSWQPVPVLWEFTAADVAREADVLERLAEQTALTNCSWTAASALFGGPR